MRMSRRTLLACTGALSAGLLLPTRAVADDGVAALRQRWLEVLTGGAVDPADPDLAAALARTGAVADAHAALLDTTTGRSRVFTDLPLNDSAGMGVTYTRLRDLALAWRLAGTGRTGDAATLDAIVAGLDLTHRVVYHAGATRFGNWWFWEIGAPQALADTCVLVYDHVAGEPLTRYLAAVDYFTPDPRRMIDGRYTSTGANRVDLCLVAALSGALGGRTDRLAQARDALPDVFAYVTSGDGFYVDGSFVQHNTIAYTGTYGSVLLGGVARLVQLLAGSAWEITDPRRAVLFDAVTRTYAPVLHDGRDLDFVRGRAISRERASDHVDGHAMIEGIVRLAAGAPQAATAAWLAMAKGWWTRDRTHPVLRTGSPARIALAKRLLADAAVPATPEPVAHRQFPSMDRAVHRRPGWAYAISLSSQRIAYFESGNGENPRGWYTGCGMTYLYDGDGAQFSDAFWPTVDAMRLPGTTVDTRPLPPDTGNGRRPDVSFAGGAVLSEPGDAAAGPMVAEFGVVGARIAPPASPLRAVKSWFCLDDRIVALGAGITGGSGARVETVLENRNLGEHGRHPLTVDGDVQPTDLGWSAAIDDAGWAHLDGVAGYVLLTAGAVRAKREARTGTWRDINTGGDTAGSTTPHTRRYLTLWLDHGVDPRDATYGYVLLPGASSARTAEVAGDPGVEVVANSAAVQAVRVPHLRLTAAVFHAAGSAAGITVSGPAVVLLREESGRATVAVSDPSRATVPLTVGLNRQGYARVRAADPEVTVLAVRPTPRLHVDLTRARGGTRAVSLAR